jgi:hypothetical protein
VGAIRPNDFPRQTNEYGQADSDHASSRTDPDHAECLTGIYGSVSVRRPPIDLYRVSAAHLALKSGHWANDTATLGTP